MPKENQTPMRFPCPSCGADELVFSDQDWYCQNCSMTNFIWDMVTCLQQNGHVEIVSYDNEEYYADQEEHMK